MEVCRVGFGELGIADWLCRHLFSIGFESPTEVQKSCIPSILQGNFTEVASCDGCYGVL